MEENLRGLLLYLIAIYKYNIMYARANAIGRKVMAGSEKI